MSASPAASEVRQARSDVRSRRRSQPTVRARPAQAHVSVPVADGRLLLVLTYVPDRGVVLARCPDKHAPRLLLDSLGPEDDSAGLVQLITAAELHAYGRPYRCALLLAQFSASAVRQAPLRCAYGAIGRAELGRASNFAYAREGDISARG